MQRSCVRAAGIICCAALSCVSESRAGDDSLISSAAPIEVYDSTSQDGRRWLRDHGVNLAFSYITEAFGGSRKITGTGGADILGSFTSTVDIDLKTLRAGRGRFYFSGQAVHGRGINEARLHAAQPPSNLEAQGFGKFVEAWYSDSYLDGSLTVKAGRQYADADFGLVENASTFLNASYGALPTSPMPTYPDPRLGVSIEIAPSRHLSWGLGVYSGGTLEPLDESGEPLARSCFTVAEARLKPFSSDSSHEATYRAGVWRQGNGAWNENGAVTRNYGVYAAADHWLAKQEGSGGPGVFARWGWSPANRNAISGYVAAGFLYDGLGLRRSGDAIGFGINRASLGRTGAETAYEIFYRMKVASGLTIEPDLQWMHHIAGERRSGLVAGIRLAIDF